MTHHTPVAIATCTVATVAQPSHRGSGAEVSGELSSAIRKRVVSRRRCSSTAMTRLASNRLSPSRTPRSISRSRVDRDNVPRASTSLTARENPRTIAGFSLSMCSSGWGVEVGGVRVSMTDSPILATGPGSGPPSGRRRRVVHRIACEDRESVRANRARDSRWCRETPRLSGE